MWHSSTALASGVLISSGTSIASPRRTAEDGSPGPRTPGLAGAAPRQPRIRRRIGWTTRCPSAILASLYVRIAVDIWVASNVDGKRDCFQTVHADIYMYPM